MSETPPRNGKRKAELALSPPKDAEKHPRLELQRLIEIDPCLCVFCKLEALASKENAITLEMSRLAQRLMVIHQMFLDSINRQTTLEEELDAETEVEP